MQAITVNLSAPYTVIVTVTDLNYCSASARDTIRAGTIPIDTMSTTSGSTCRGGSVSVRVGPAGQMYSYNWSNGATNTDSIGNVGQGEYYVTVSIANGCSSYDSAYVIASTTGITITFDTTHYNCNDDTARDSIFAHASGGDGTFNYVWSNGGSTDSFVVVTLDVTHAFTVTVSDNGGCSDSASVVKQAYRHLSVSLSTNNSSCGGSILDIPDGGFGRYTYSWSNDSVSQDLFNVSPGTYILTLTDAVGCRVKDTTTLISVGAFTVSLDSTRVTCFGYSNGSVSAIVSGGQYPFSYFWSDSLTGSIISGLYAGTYAVTVTDNNACTATAFAHVDQADAISITLTTTQPTCGQSNGSIFATVNGGTPGYTYFYNVYAPGNQTPLVTSLWGNPTGQAYTLFVTDTLGCTAQKSDTLYNNLTQLTVFGQPEDGSCSGANGSISLYHVTGGTAPYHYQWSNGDSTRNIANLIPGTYAVTVTDTMNCTKVISVVVNRNYASCCFNDSVGITGFVPIDTNTNSSSLTIEPGEDIYVGANITLTIDNNFSFQNCQVVMGSNSVIVVESGDTLNILGSTFRGCDSMWLGIYVLVGGAINVTDYDSTRSVIEDAVKGIELLSHDGVKAMVRNTDFKRNQEGVEFNGYLFEGAIESPANYDISNCTFGMGDDTTMLPAPGGRPNYTHPLAGVYIQWSQPISISTYFDTIYIPNPRFGGSGNTFKKMNSGIYALMSGENGALNVSQNTFDSIHNFDNLTGSYYGAGVAAIGSGFTTGGYSSLLVKTASSAPDSLSPIHFLNCDYGIATSRMALSAFNNRMENIGYGIYAQLAPRVVNTKYNYINNTNYGISLINNSSATQVALSNVIYVNPPSMVRIPGVIGLRLVHGMLVADTLYELTNIQTYGIEESEVTSSVTTIQQNTIWNGMNCILLNNTKNTFIYENTMHLNDGISVVGRRAGLYAANCSGLFVKGNYCDADSNFYQGTPNPTIVPTSSNRHISGLSFYNTYSGTVCNNALGGTNPTTGVGLGMLMSSFCDQLVIYNNVLNQSKYGIALQSSGIAHILGDEGDSLQSQKNNFLGDGYGNFGGGYRTASYLNLGFDSIIVYQPSTFYYDSIAPLTSPGLGYASVNNIVTPPERIRPVKTFSDDLPDILCYLPFPIPTFFPFPHFRVGLMDSIIAENNTRYYMEPGFDTTGPWLACKMLYESLYHDTAILNNDSLINAFYANKDTSDLKAILLSEIQNQLLNDSATIVDSTAKASAILTAQSFTNNVPDTNVQAANYKAMSNIYLRTLATGADTFTNGQLDTIASLAIQCPYTAGDAVYMARALYAQYDNTIFFDDLAICTLLSGDSERMLRIANGSQDTAAKISSPEYIIVYPNPAKNILKVFYSSVNNALMTFELTDMMGQTIIARQVSNMTTIELDVSNIASGLYLWRGRNGNIVIRNGKVSINK